MKKTKNTRSVYPKDLKLRTMWELRKDDDDMKRLERLYPHHTNECLACRFRTKQRVMDKFGEKYYKTEKHKQEETRRSQMIRELSRQHKPIPPRKCPFAAFIACEYTFPLQDCCYFAAEMPFNIKG